MTEIIKTDNQLSENLKATAEQANQYFANQMSENTARAYRSDWQDFQNFCTDHNLPSLPAAPETIVLYITQLAETKAVSTIDRRIAAIAKFHKLSNEITPTTASIVTGTYKGIRRAKGVAQKQAKAITLDALKQVISQLDSSKKKGLRDKAILLLGFIGCLRRSEIAALDLSDLERTDRGFNVLLRKSKSDQEGEGVVKAVPFSSNPDLCPVRALDAWIEVSDCDTPLFIAIGKGDRLKCDKRIDGQSINLLIKKYFGKEYSGHSLRVGFAVEARDNGASMDAIQTQGGWKSSAMPRRYTEQADRWKDNAAFSLGL